MILFYTFLWTWGFWLLYILVMGLYRAHLAKRLKGIPLYLAYPAVVVGYLVDLISNYTVAMIVFLEPPRKINELVTDRLTRYINQEEENYRKKLAKVICQSLLDPFDPSGIHCSPVKLDQF